VAGLGGELTRRVNCIARARCPGSRKTESAGQSSRMKA
jgi:hypothetical protein